jgi:hypothetical protein
LVVPSFQFALGFAPEFFIPAFGLAGELPQLMSTGSDLVFGRIGQSVSAYKSVPNIFVPRDRP